MPPATVEGTFHQSAFAAESSDRLARGLLLRDLPTSQLAALLFRCMHPDEIRSVDSPERFM
jgi:hypothetical protein